MRIRRNSLAILVLLALGVFAPRLGAQSVLEEGWEKEANKRQPPREVMDRAGVKPGMIIGEIGAGRGRYSVHLAARVGEKGKVFANDIDARGLAHLEERCRKQRIANIQTVLGKPDDPLFPVTGLDAIFMVWTYHMMEKPVVMLRSMARYLKPEAAIIMLEPVAAETEAEIKEIAARTGKTPNDVHVVTKESLAKDAREAGFELVMADTSLKSDVLYILRVQAGR
jgi:ubiquinone/menaquinone biosynthesis C-methylase UbiE